MCVHNYSYSYHIDNSNCLPVGNPKFKGASRTFPLVQASRINVDMGKERQTHTSVRMSYSVIERLTFFPDDFNASQATSASSKRRMLRSGTTGIRDKSAPEVSRLEGAFGNILRDESECAPVLSPDGGLPAARIPERSRAA